MSVVRGRNDINFRIFNAGDGSVTTIARLTLAQGDIGSLPSGGARSSPTAT